MRVRWSQSTQHIPNPPRSTIIRRDILAADPHVRAARDGAERATSALVGYVIKLLVAVAESGARRARWRCVPAATPRRRGERGGAVPAAYQEVGPREGSRRRRSASSRRGASCCCTTDQTISSSNSE